MNTPMARNSSNAATSTIKLRSSIDVLPSRLNGVPLLRSVVVMHVGPADALSLLVQDPKVNDVRRYTLSPSACTFTTTSFFTLLFLSSLEPAVSNR
jgi:hypothetical protein